MIRLKDKNTEICFIVYSVLFLRANVSQMGGEAMLVPLQVPLVQLAKY